MSIAFHLLTLKDAIAHKIALGAKQIESSINIFRQNSEVKRAFLSKKGSVFSETLMDRRRLFIIAAVIVSALLLTYVFEINDPTNIQNNYIKASVKDKKLSLHPLIKEKKDKKEMDSDKTYTKAEPERGGQLKRTGTEDKSESVTEKDYHSIFEGQQYVLLASKKDKKLLVGRNYNNGKLEIVKKFTASFGKISGDKKVEGDMKTPEGIYKIVKVKPKRELTKIFGPKAFVLNYPNKLDRKEGKSGSNIWIHGTGTNSVTPDTKGCVEINDRDIEVLTQYIAIDTPIVIFPERYNILSSIEKNYIKESLIKDILIKEAKI